MAVSARWFSTALKGFINGDYSWDASTFKVALVTSSWTPNQDTPDFWNDIETYECAATGNYVQIATGAGKDLTTSAATNTANVTFMDATDVSWTSSTITARYAVIVRWNSTDANSEVIGWVDFGADQSSSSGTFTITWHSDGVFKITAEDL